jgi:hypothetical protein
MRRLTSCFNYELFFQGRPEMKRFIALLASACVLTGCSDDSAKNELKQILECSMAAKLVGQTAKIDIISNHANLVAAKSGYEPTLAEGKQMHDEIKAKWNLKSLSRHDQDQLLVGVYNSKLCRSLHQGDPLSVEDVPPDA